MSQGDERPRHPEVLGEAAVLLIAQGQARKAAVPQPAQAVVAAAAGDYRAEGDAPAERRAVHPLPQGGDDAYVLVAGYYARPGGLLPLVNPDVGVAGAGRLHAQEDLAGAGLGVGERFDADVAGAVEDAGLQSSTMVWSSRPALGNSPSGGRCSPAPLRWPLSHPLP